MALSDISGGVCEKCGGHEFVSTHHIWPRSLGRTINRLWNGIKLCDKCHKSGNYEAKIDLFTIHLNNMIIYCQTWVKRPNKEWTRLEPGTIANLDEMRQQMRDEGVRIDGNY